MQGAMFESHLSLAPQPALGQKVFQFDPKLTSLEADE